MKKLKKHTKYKNNKFKEKIKNVFSYHIINMVIFLNFFINTYMVWSSSGLFFKFQHKKLEIFKIYFSCFLIT